MKVLILVAALFVAALADNESDLQAARKVCQSNPETTVDNETLQKLKNHEKVENLPPSFGKHEKCIQEQLGTLNADGKIDSAAFKKRLQQLLNDDETKVDEAMEKCAVDQATPEQTATYIAGCLYKNHYLH